MMMLGAAATAFLLLHLLISGTRLRDALTGRIGEGPYSALFSLASVALLAWLIFAYAQARGSVENSRLWSAPHWMRFVQLGLQCFALLLVVPGLATPNPTGVRQMGVLKKANAVQGMLRITRHPFLWGVAIWASGHLLVSGDLAGLIVFGAMLLLALFGTASIDAKRKRTLHSAWDVFAGETSNVPFAAILGRRQRLDLAEIGWWRLGLAIAIYAALLFAHPYAFGASPLP